MTTLTECTLKINTYPAWYVDSVAAEALAAAAVYFTENPGLPWTAVCDIYLNVFGKAEGVDLSNVTIPAAPDTTPTVDEFNAALLDDPDYADFLAQTMTGVPMF